MFSSPLRSPDSDTSSFSFSPTSPSPRLPHAQQTQQRRHASLQRTFTSQMSSPTRPASSPAQSPSPSDPLRDRRRRQRLDLLVQKRQAMYHAMRGGDDEMLRLFHAAETRKLEQDLRAQALQADISIDELLAIEDEARAQADQMMAEMVQESEQKQVEEMLALMEQQQQQQQEEEFLVEEIDEDDIMADV